MLGSLVPTFFLNFLATVSPCLSSPSAKEKGGRLGDTSLFLSASCVPGTVLCDALFNLHYKPSGEVFFAYILKQHSWDIVYISYNSPI